MEKEIDMFNLSEEQKDYLKSFVRLYGRKEKKRPRDRLLRDGEIKGKVMELRKKGAFLGYTYRRIRDRDGDVVGERRISGHRSPLPAGKGRTVWHRARLSVQ